MDLPTDIWLEITRFYTEGLGRWYELQRVSKRWAAQVRQCLRNFTVTLDRPVLLTNLGHFQQDVRKLYLRTSTQVSLHCLSHLVKLTELHMTTKASSLEVLEPLTSLRVLSINVDGNGLELMDLTPLSRLPQLHTVCLRRCRVWSGSFCLLTQVKTVRLYDIHLTNRNIQDLSTLSQLEWLDLALNYKLGWDASPLGKLNLRKLTLAGDCTKFHQACNPNLEMLSISHTRVSDLRWISSLVNLRVLHVSYCPHILDVRPLLQLKRLTDIYARETKFTVVSYFTMAPRVNFHF